MFLSHHHPAAKKNKKDPDQNQVRQQTRKKCLHKICQRFNVIVWLNILDFCVVYMAKCNLLGTPKLPVGF